MKGYILSHAIISQCRQTEKLSKKTIFSTSLLLCFSWCVANKRASPKRATDMSPQISRNWCRLERAHQISLMVLRAIRSAPGANSIYPIVPCYFLSEKHQEVNNLPVASLWPAQLPEHTQPKTICLAGGCRGWCTHSPPENFICRPRVDRSSRLAAIWRKEKQPFQHLLYNIYVQSNHWQYIEVDRFSFHPRMAREG